MWEREVVRIVRPLVEILKPIMNDECMIPNGGLPQCAGRKSRGPVFKSTCRTSKTVVGSFLVRSGHLCTILFSLTTAINCTYSAIRSNRELRLFSSIYNCRHPDLKHRRLDPFRAISVTILIPLP
jgi:hypothetical protein